MAKVLIASEIVELAGFDPKQIGKVRVRIGGVAVNKPDHILNCGDAKKVDVIVGVESVEAELPSKDGVSELAHSVLEKQGRERTKAYEAKRKAANKAEATEDEASPEATDEA